MRNEMMIPVSGSAYSYSYATLGEGVAWFIGWNLILEYLFAAGTVAVGWSGYVVSLVEQLGFHLPDALTNAPFTKGAGHFEIVRTGAIINLPAVLIIAAITCRNSSATYPPWPIPRWCSTWSSSV